MSSPAMNLYAELINSGVVQARCHTDGSKRNIRGAMQSEYPLHAVQNASLQKAGRSFSGLLRRSIRNLQTASLPHPADLLYARHGHRRASMSARNAITPLLVYSPKITPNTPVAPTREWGMPA